MPLWIEAFNDIAELIVENQAAARARLFFAELVTVMAADRESIAVVRP